jgi:predicted nucleic acid-binding protein
VRTLFLDTSALVKLYVAETGTDALVEAASESRLVVLGLARAELCAATWRRQRQGDMTVVDAEGIVERFAKDVDDFIDVIDVSEGLIDKACALTRASRLRAYDAMHLATALDVADAGLDITFVAADGALLDAAAHHGLKVWNPAASTPTTWDDGGPHAK